MTLLRPGAEEADQNKYRDIHNDTAQAPSKKTLEGCGSFKNPAFASKSKLPEVREETDGQ